MTKLLSNLVDKTKEYIHLHDKHNNTDRFIYERIRCLDNLSSNVNKISIQHTFQIQDFESKECELLKAFILAILEKEKSQLQTKIDNKDCLFIYSYISEREIDDEVYEFILSNPECFE